MTLDEYLSHLKPYDLSIALGLLELVRRADESGAVDRGEWLAAVRSAYIAHVADVRDDPDVPADAGEPGDYLDDHVLARLTADGIAAGEPEGPVWERIRLNAAIRATVLDDRSRAEGDVEQRIRDLLSVAERQPDDGASPVRRGPIEGGSSLSASGLVKTYRKRRVVSDVNLRVAQGEIVGLLGPNGAGKTTTFYMMVGLVSPDQGTVQLDDTEITRVPMYKRARAGIGYLAQEPSIFRKLTVEQNILAILEQMPLKRAERKARLEELLDELGLKHLRKSRAYSLSGGERRRLEITRALVAEPKFMLLDEPFAGVDPIAVHDIQQIVADLRLRGIGVIITDHNVEQTLDIVDRAYIMYDGKVRVSGTVAELVWNEEVAEIYFGPTLTARMRERYPRPEAAA
jgi:lipopolysaccharide export system ATP-binding protein